MLSLLEKTTLRLEYPPFEYPQHHPISMLFKKLVYAQESNYEKVADILYCLTLSDDLCFFEGLYNSEWSFIMARSTMWTFANVSLTSADDKEIDAYIKSQDNDVLGVLVELMSTGYKVSSSWIDDQNSFVVTVSGSDRSKINKGVSMTSWSDSLADAIMVTGFKVFVKCESEEWQSYEQIGGRR